MSAVVQDAIVRGVTSVRVVSARCQSPLLSCVVIPGNPGSCRYYRAFVNALFEAGGRRINVFAISHAGHIPVSTDGLSKPAAVESDRDWFNVAEQVEHSLTLVKQLVKENEKLVLIGHSLGSWLITQILHQLRDYDVVKVFHLFPGLAHLARSPNGQKLSPFFGSYQWVAHWLISAIQCLPTSWVNFVLGWHFSSTPHGYREEMVCATKEILCQRVARNCLSLANEEMRTITDFNFAVLKEYNARSTYICAVDDGWFPLERVEELQNHVPDADVLLVDTIKHAFVLEKSEEVAELIWEKLELVAH